MGRAHRPLAILHVVPTYAPAWRYGGPIHAIHGLCRGLVAMGHRVDVFTTNVDGPGVLDVPTSRPVERDGVSVTYFECAWPRRIYRSPQMARALHAKAGAFDVVHLHSVFLWPTLVAARVAARSGVPYVVSPRGMLVPELISAKSYWLKSAWIALFERRTMARAHAIHVTSSVEASGLRRAGLALARLSVIPNGVDPVARALSHPEPRQVVYIGRLSWKKNLEMLIDSIAILEDVTLLIAGPDDEALREPLMRRARRSRVDNRVRFLGAVGEVARTELLASSACLVLPSLNENFGNVVIEAMSQGCPVVVTPEVGARDVVEASGGGAVADDTTATAIAVAIARVLVNEAARVEMGQRGRRFVEARLGWRNIAGDMAALYNELTASGSIDAQ